MSGGTNASIGVIMGSKNTNESFLQYKQRVLDTKSASFCGAKWYNATIWLGSGMTTSCHHPLPHKVSVEEVEANPKALHNTAQKKLERQMMQTGQRPSGCEYCWRIEDSSPDAVSDRPYKSMIYSEYELDWAAKASTEEDFNLRTLEIAFDRTCNFACSYCNPAFSTTWVKDIKQHGPYTNLTSDGRNHFTHEHGSSQLYRVGEENPYVEAFFKWWESDLKNSLRELRITGGEPTMSADFWRLIDWFKDNKSNVKLAINSNLGAKQDLIDKLIAASHDIPHVELYTSCEATGVAAEYIRDGMVWRDWIDNVNRLVEEGNFKALHVMATINALCLPTITEFLDLILLSKEQYGKNWPTVTLNILRFPSFQSPLVLPLEYRKQVVVKMRDWFAKNGENTLLHEMERQHILRLITYLETVDSPHIGASPVEELQKDFKNFYTHYDQRRNKNFVSTFPKLKTWYEGI
jgi:organic radical activating enzyme